MIKMDELDFTKLQQRVKEALDSRSELLAENRQLHKKLASASRERTLLLNSKESVSKKLKNIIKHLKEELL